MNKKYFVSRQIQFDTGLHIVEVNLGGIDYANPDMLAPNPDWHADGYETDDPRNAAENAIWLARQWHKKLKRSRKSKKDKVPAVHVGHGHTGGATLPFDICSYKQLVVWAEKEYETLPKCRYCGEIITGKSYGHQWTEIEGEYPFCSRHCAEHDEYRITQENWIQAVVEQYSHLDLNYDIKLWSITVDGDNKGVDLYYKIKDKTYLCFRMNLLSGKIEQVN